MKKNKILMIMSIVVLIVILLGTTFSYFAAFVKSDRNVETVAANFDASVILSVYIMIMN